MSLFGSLMNDFDDDPFYGAHFRQMRHVNSLMNSLISDPFGTLGEMGVPLPIMGPHPYARSSMMPFMPPPMNMNRLLIGGLDDSLVNGRCNSYSSSTVVMSNGPDGRPQVYSATSSTQMGPGGVKETRQTVQDSRTGTKKMSIGHHINDRAHVIEREQNVRSGDLEEREEFINIEEEEAEDFTREFGQRLRGSSASSRPRPLAITAPPVPSARRSRLPRRPPSSTLALTAPPSSSPHISSSSAVRQTYSSLHPQRTKQRNPKHHHSSLDY